MFIQQYFNDSNLLSYEAVKEHFGDKMTFKDHPKLPLYMISFNGKSDMTKNYVKECNGLILEKETNKLVHHAFSKCYDAFDFKFLQKKEEELFAITENSNFVVSKMQDATMFRVYFYGGEWRFATSRHLEPKKNFWGSTTSIQDLFEECVLEMFKQNISEFTETLDKNYAYTYFFRHPTHKMVVNVTSPDVYLGAKVLLETGEEFVEINKEITALDDSVFKGEVDMIISFLTSDNVPLEENYMFYEFSENEDGKNVVKNRIKCTNKNFLNNKLLKGDHPNLEFRYLELLSDPLLKKQFFNLYSDDCEKFVNIEQKFDVTCKEIHAYYMDKYVKKVQDIDDTIPVRYLPSLKYIHGAYKRERKPVRLPRVTEIMIDLGNKNCKHLAHILEMI